MPIVWWAPKKSMSIGPGLHHDPELCKTVADSWQTWMKWECIHPTLIIRHLFMNLILKIEKRETQTQWYLLHKSHSSYFAGLVTWTLFIALGSSFPYNNLYAQITHLNYHSLFLSPKKIYFYLIVVYINFSRNVCISWYSLVALASLSKTSVIYILYLIIW